MAECLNCLGNPGGCTCTPKQISRDDVDALAAQLAEANEELEKLKANVIGAMNELHRRAGERQRLLFLRNKSLEAQLAAANERAEKAENDVARLDNALADCESRLSETDQ